MEQSNPSSISVPIWAIVVIAIVIILIVIVGFFFLKRRRTRSYSVETIHRSKDYSIKEMKKSESLGSFQTLVTQQQKQRPMKFDESFITTTPLPEPPLPNKKQLVEGTISPLYKNNEKTDKPASIFNELDYSYSTPEPSQEIKISLPLPPPSSSFFSDKMELNDDSSQDLYNMYLSSKPAKKNEFISIDLDTGPSFYSSATANIQQKAATMKNSLYQSLKIQKGNSRTSAQQMFSDQAPKNSGDSYGYQPKSSEKTHHIQNSSTITTDSNKTIIDMREFNNTTKQQLKSITVLHSPSNTVAIDDESPITPNLNLQEPARAAKRVIRSASRKTKTRSMVVDEKDLLPINDEENTDYQIMGGTVKDSKKSKRDSVRFASFRGPRNSGEHMTITSGSMRRLVRESILFDNVIIPSMPSAAAMASTRNTSSRKSIISAVDIASWWESNNDTPKNSNSATITTNEDSDNSLPLFQNITAGSNSSSTPHQYRASLTTSIFGTLSKPGAAIVNEVNNEGASNATRHNSFRRGTLSRNTLRNITAGATNVNRSIKGLFDNSSSKVVPDDSQKMELDPASTQIEEITGQQELYSSIRQKSVRNTTQSRPSIPTAYLPNSESSTKYALSDEDYFPDQHSTVDQKPDEKKNPEEEIKQNLSPTTERASNGEVDTIRRMLQDTWKNNMKESGSMFSISSETESVATNSTQKSASTVGVSEFNNPRQQNQSLLTKSLLTQQVVRKASLLARTRQIDDFVFQQGPEPSASFSSSTAKTMVPEVANEPISIRQNAINHGSNKIQESCDSSLINRLSTSPTSPRNSSANSSRGHSRKSSGGNSAATALRISSGYSTNAKTWNGRANQKRNSRPMASQLLDDQETTSTPDTAHLILPLQQSIGRASVNKRAFFSTMRKGQKNRGSIPWMTEGDDQDRTPAQIERDRYLEGKF